MPVPEPGLHTKPAQTEEWGAALVLLPAVATFSFYALPTSLQEQTWILFAPQIIAYSALGLWAFHNHDFIPRLGLEKGNVRQGLRWGLLTGLLLGCLNTMMILSVYPHLGYDIDFLKTTLHGRLPFLLMVPWFICSIAFLVELNYRGFLLGRLAALESRLWSSALARRFPPFALIASAMLFAFDPFMVDTFQHLHWIAVWDGLIWGAIWLRTKNLYITMVAHAIEVLVMYSIVRKVLIS
jgi:membrane protease YdiL (CAAX protease family)